MINKLSRTCAPTVAGFQAWKAECRNHCRNIVARRLRKFEKRIAKSSALTMTVLVTVLLPAFSIQQTAGEAAKFGRSGVELLGVVCAALLESGKPAAEAGELIRRQLGNSLGDFFDFHVTEYSTLSRACGATDEPRTLTREYPAIV
jgi:hypothetical protein